ncbi:MAG: hypothetical protein ISR65_05865 [Bacteriovoracaceae bacterium]|nr:hypothetical protein [Bacteriovoracaceae bacterium]
MKKLIVVFIAFGVLMPFAYGRTHSVQNIGGYNLYVASADAHVDGKVPGQSGEDCALATQNDHQSIAKAKVGQRDAKQKPETATSANI